MEEVAVGVAIEEVTVGAVLFREGGRIFGETGAKEGSEGVGSPCEVSSFESDLRTFLEGGRIRLCRL